MEEERELLKCVMELKKVILICINTQNEEYQELQFMKNARTIQQ